MRKVAIISSTAPAKPRSDKYPIGTSVARTSSGTTIINQGGGESVDIVKTGDSISFTDKNVLSSLRAAAEFISKKNDSSVEAVVDFLKGLKINGVPITRVIQKATKVDEFSDTDVMTALRVLAEIANNSEELKKIFLRKDRDDEAAGLITFLKGLLIGENGSGITVLENGMSQAVVDYLYVKVKAIFEELEVKKKTYVGGEQILSPAGMKCIKVEELADAYRCFFKSEEDGVEIENKFTPGTLAIAQECNIKVGVSHHVGNRYYWREVTAVGTDYIDLSKTKCDLNIENDIPSVGDDIVALGHSSDIARQGAIILSSVNEVAPSIIMYQGIDSFSLDGREVIGFDFDKVTGRAKMRVYGDSYTGAKDRSSFIENTQEGGVEVKGKLHIQPGSTGFENVSGLEFGKVNLLRNSAFTGDYNSALLEEGTELEPETDLYSQALKFWAATNATVNVDAASQSGRSATLNAGILLQTLHYKMMAGEKYIISLRAKGSSVSVSCAGLEKTETLTPDYQRFIYKFEATAETEFTVSGTCTICELQLERGTVPSEWSMSPLDNNSSEAKFEALRYLTDVIKNGSATFIGGLGLMSMLKLGNYVDGEMKKETAGVSGVYNDDDDVAFYAGGNYEQAVQAVLEYLDNPNRELDEGTLAEIAKVVITHGGRAILNDVILRGYVYALGGYFRGTFDAADGKTHIDEDGTGWIGRLAEKYFARWDADGNGSLCFGNILWDSVRKLLTVDGRLNAKGGSKLGNLTINENGAQIGGNAVFEEITYLFMGPPVMVETQEQIAARVRDSIINQIARSTTIFLNVNRGQVDYRYTVNLPTRDEIYEKAGVNNSYGFRLTIIVTSSMFKLPGSQFDAINFNPTFRITSRPRQSNNLFGDDFPTGEMHDNNDNLIDYIDMSKGDVLELYCYNGIYYLLNRRN